MKYIYLCEIDDEEVHELDQQINYVTNGNMNAEEFISETLGIAISRVTFQSSMRWSLCSYMPRQRSMG